MGDVRDPRLPELQRRRGRGEAVQEDILLNIANDVHEILLILRGDYNSKKEEEWSPVNVPAIGPRSFKQPTGGGGAGGGAGGNPPPNNPIVYSKSRERGPDFTKFYKLYGNIGLTKGHLTSFFGVIKNMYRAVVNGFSKKSIVGGLRNLKQSFMRGVRGEAVSSDPRILLSKSPITKIFGKGFFNGIANLAGNGVGTIADLSGVIKSFINNSFLIHYSKQMLKTQAKGLKLSFQRGLQGKSVFPEMKSNKLSSFKKIFGKGFLDGIANIGGRVMRMGNKLFADKITNTKIGIKMVKQDAQKFLKKDSFIRGKHGAKQPVGSSKFQKTVNGFGKLINTFSQATNSIRQSVFGSISQKELNKKAAVMFKKINPNFVNQTLRQKRSDAVKQQTQRILSRYGNKHTESQASRKAGLLYDRGVLKDKNGVALKDVHKQQTKQEANQRLSEIKDKIRHDVRENTLAKRFVRRFVSGDVSNDVRRRMVKNAKKNLFPGYIDHSKVSPHLRQYEIKGLADKNNLWDSKDYRRTYNAVRFKHARNAADQIRALDNNNELKKRAAKGAHSDLQKGLYNYRINEITDDLTKAEVKKIKNTAKQDLKSGKITKAEYRQRISNINRDNIRNEVSSKAERMALDQAYNKNFKELKKKEVIKIIKNNTPSSQQLHKETNDEMRRKRNFLAEKKVEKTLRNYSLKGSVDVLRRKFNAGVKRGRSNFFIGVRDGFNGEKWNGEKSIKGKLGWGIGRAIRYGKNTSQGIRAGIRGEGFKSQSGFWGKTGLGIGRLIAPSVNFVQGGLAGIRGEGFKSQSGFMRKTGWVFGKPVNWGRSFTTGARSFLNNERGLRYNSAGRIIGRDGRVVSHSSLNWGQKARLNFSAGYNGNKPLSRGFSYAMGYGSRMFKPVVRGVQNYNAGYQAGLNGEGFKNQSGFLRKTGYGMGRMSPHVGRAGMGALGLIQMFDAGDQLFNSKYEGNRDYTRIAQGFLGGAGGLAMSLGHNRIGGALSIASSLPGLLATKDVYDEYGNVTGKQWDAYNASYAMQNIATYALPMKMGGGISPWAIAAQAAGAGINYGSQFMDEGAAKYRTQGLGNALSGGGAFAADVGLTVATGGLNKVVQGAFQIGRLFTDEGQKRASNIGASSTAYDIITKVAGVQSLFQGIGGIGQLITGDKRTGQFWDIGGALNEIDSGHRFTEALFDNENSAIVNESDKQRHKQLSELAMRHRKQSTSLFMTQKTRDQHLSKAQEYEAEMTALERKNREKLREYHNFDKAKRISDVKINSALNVSDVFAGQYESYRGVISQSSDKVHTELKNINEQKQKQASEQTRKIREEVSSYDNDLARYNAMNEQQKASEQGRRLKSSIDARTSSISDKRNELELAQNNERVVKAQSEVFSQIIDTIMPSSEQMEQRYQSLMQNRERLTSHQSEIQNTQKRLDQARRNGDTAAEQREMANMQRLITEADPLSQKVLQDTEFLESGHRGIKNNDPVVKALLEKHKNGTITNGEYLQLASRTNTRITQQQFNTLTGRDENGNYTSQTEQEIIAGREAEAAEQAAQESSNPQQQSNVPQIGIVDVGQKNDIGTNVQKIVNILERYLGSDNPYLGSQNSSVRQEDTIFQGYNQNYISDPNINRDYLNIAANDAYNQSLLVGERQRQLSHYNDANGIFSANYRGIPVVTPAESTEASSNTNPATSQQNIKIEVSLKIDPNEFSNLLKQHAVNIVRTAFGTVGRGMN